MGKKVIWTNHAISELNKAFLDLLERSGSVQYAKGIISEIHESASILATRPNIYKKDSLRRNNNGNIRVYEKHTYRISYKIEKESVSIIRVRYARREPLEY